MLRQALLSVTVASFAFLAACGSGGGGGPAAEPPQPKNVIVSRYDGTDASKPRFAIANLDGDRIDVFGADNADGDFVPRQAALKTAGTTAGSGNEYTVFFDANGRTERINDEANNRYLLVKPMDGGTRYELYDAANAFVGGFAILEDASGPTSVALVEGVPAFDGQLIGQLSGAVEGSFAVVATPSSGLGAPTMLPANLRTYLAVTPAAARFRADGDGSLAEGTQMLISGGARTYLIAATVAGGLALLAGAPVATAAAVAAATVALVGFGTSITALTVGGALRQLGTELPDDESRDTFNGLFGDFSQTGSPQALIDNARDRVQGIISTGAATLQNRVDAFVDRAGQAADTVADFLQPDLQPQPVQGPPAIDTSVEGFGVDSNDNQYRYTGTVMPSGDVSLNGTANGGAQQVSVNATLDSSSGTVSGTYNSPQGSGQVDGEASDFGTCQTVQNAGGQGTFSFVSNVGAASGTVDFTYEAFTIPDAFTVMNAGATVFSTGGLVSGGTTVSFPVSNAIVFVNVSAPNDGTAWEYELGCAI